MDARRLTDIIGPLLSNRGFTRTHALNPNSLAIDRADNSSCPLNDQRGEARNDGSCDIGAVEYIQGMDAATIEVNSAYDVAVAVLCVKRCKPLTTVVPQSMVVLLTAV